MGIESEADKDLVLGDQDAENVIGGRAVRKTTKRTAAAKPRGPLMIEQAVTYGPTEISRELGRRRLRSRSGRFERSGRELTGEQRADSQPAREPAGPDGSTNKERAGASRAPALPRLHASRTFASPNVQEATAMRSSLLGRGCGENQPKG